MSILDLPDDILRQTLFKDSFVDVCNICNTNKELHDTICNNRFWYDYGVYNQYIDMNYDSSISYKQYIFRNYIMKPVALNYSLNSPGNGSIPSELSRFLTMSMINRQYSLDYTPDLQRFMDLYRCNKLYVSDKDGTQHVARSYFNRQDNCDDIKVDNHRIRTDVYKMMHNNTPFYIVFFLVIGKYQRRGVNRLWAVKIYIPGQVSDDIREAIDTFFRNNLPKILKHQYPKLQQSPQYFW